MQHRSIELGHNYTDIATLWLINDNGIMELT